MYSIQVVQGDDIQLINIDSNDMEITSSGDALYRDKKGIVLCCFNAQTWMSSFKINPKTEEPIGVTIFEDNYIDSEDDNSPISADKEEEDFEAFED